MKLVVAAVLGTWMVCLAASCAVCDQVVYQEDFSGLQAPFAERDWVYNNSGPEGVMGYGGRNWPCRINSDGWPLPDHLSYPSGPGGPYWSEYYNHRCVEYGQEIQATRDTYDWMSCDNEDGSPVNTHPQKPGCYKASLPGGWTAAISGIWADWDPNRAYYSSGRAKMGFGPMMGQYAQSPDNPCLHMWSSHGSLRIASPPITTGPGVYVLNWRAGVWNCNTADPAMQYKWTDWCQWGFGYTNWCVWDDDPITTPPYSGDPDDPVRGNQVNQIDTGRFWVWLKDPFHDSDPDGVNPNVPDIPHPPGEEPGTWHSFSRAFAFGELPIHDPGPFDNQRPGRYEFNKPPDYFIGFNVGHGHDYNNQGYRWGTILNVDDIVLVKKDPVTIEEAREMPVGSLVEIADLVITNMVVAPDPFYPEYVDVYLESQDRSAGIMLRAFEFSRIWDSDYMQFAYERGDVVRVVGAVSKRDASWMYPTSNTKYPVKYISGWLQGSRLPAIVKTQAEPVEIEPVAVTNRALVGKPVSNGLTNAGMLVTVYGRVNNCYPLQPAYFYLDDGSGVTAGLPYWGAAEDAKGVKIDCTGLQLDFVWGGPPWDGQYVAVTGTCTAELHWDESTIVRVVYPREGSDIRAIQE